MRTTIQTNGKRVAEHITTDDGGQRFEITHTGRSIVLATSIKGRDGTWTNTLYAPDGQAQDAGNSLYYSCAAGFILENM